MLSYDIAADDDDYNGELETGPPAHQFFATAPVPIATIRLFAACILVRSSNSKRAGRDSIAAQETFQIVHFLARAGRLAEPAAQFL